MTLNDYQEYAGRTINDKLKSSQMELHALHGMAAEVGEIHSIYQKVYQGHMVPEVEMIEELGDLLWFIAEYCTARGYLLDEVGTYNIVKLKQRYPEGFSEERSVNRDQ